MMDEIAWQAHQKRARQAEEIHKMLQDLYGADIDKRTLRLKALKDRVITVEESRLLVDFCLG